MKGKEALERARRANRKYKTDKMILDLLSDIKRKVSEIKPQPEANRWIPVSERLPEYEEPVMGWDGESHDMGIVNFIYGKFLDIIDMSETNVTHWMPLPEPPKEGE